MHEPYAHGAGTMLAEYPLVLPRSPSIKLTLRQCQCATTRPARRPAMA